MSVLTSLLTGLGLLFCGVRFIASNLTPLAGPSARRLFRRAVSTSWGSGFAGILAGLVTQSTSAVTLVVVGFVRASIIPEGRAVLLPVWSQVGAAALVILVSLQTSAAVAYALAIAGIVLYFDFTLSQRIRYAVLVLLGAGLLFLGMEVLNQASGPLRAWLMGRGLIARHESGIVLLVLGLVLAAIAQSSTVAGAIAVAVVRVGIFDLGAACLLLVGASLGSAFNYGLPGWKGEAVGRHVMLFQSAQKLFGAVLLAIFLALTSGHPETLLPGLHGDLGMAFAWIFLATQIAGSLTCTVLHRPLSRVFQHLAPPKAADALARPAFLLDEALADPLLALDLVEREEQRLLERLPIMLDGVRAEAHGSGPPAETLRAAGVSVAEATRSYLAGVLESEPGREAVMRAMRMQHVLDNIVALHEATAEFQRAVGVAQADAGEAVGRLVESLHMLLEVLQEIAANHDSAEREMSLALLGDRRSVIEGLRTRLMSASGDAKVQEALFRSTVLFERILWLARDTAVALIQSSAESREPKASVTDPILAPGEASA
jgi:phosphate:Na+ symporter